MQPTMKYTKIILIDDDNIIRYGFKKLMTEFFPSQDFLIFEHGGEGLAHLNGIASKKEIEKTLILLDLNMPVTDGWSFLEIFKEKFTCIKSNISICILSSTIDKQDIKRIKENDFVSGYISKPLTLDELRELIM